MSLSTSPAITTFANAAGQFGRAGVKALLAQRYPMLWVDAVSHNALGETCIAHYSASIPPRLMILEAMGQTGSMLVAQHPDVVKATANTSDIPYFAAMPKVRWWSSLHLCPSSSPWYTWKAELVALKRRGRFGIVNTSAWLSSTPPPQYTPSDNPPSPPLPQFNAEDAVQIAEATLWFGLGPSSQPLKI